MVCETLSDVTAENVRSNWGWLAEPINGLLWATLVTMVKPLTFNAPALIWPTIAEPGKLSPAP